MLRAPRPHGLIPNSSPAASKLLPEARGLIRSDVDFESVFAGVAGVSDAGWCAADFAVGEPIVFDGAEVSLRQLLESGAAFRTLNGYLRVVGAGELHFGIELVVLDYMIEVFFLVRGVDAQEPFGIGDFVDQNVVNNAAVIIKQG